MNTAPQTDHNWLHELVGEWAYETAASEGSSKTYRGTESVRSLGGLWILAEGNGEMPDGSRATTLMTLGFDPQKGRFVGSWIGSMMTHLWLYDGELDASGRVLALDCEGPSMSGDGKMATYQDVIAVKDDDHRTLTARVLGEDGNWNTLMTVHYRRTK
jgi:hypothetical protein